MNHSNLCLLKTSRSSFVPLLCGVVIATSICTAGADDAKELFIKNCASCHSKDGKAETPAAKMLGVKDLSQSKLTKAQIIVQIQEGKQDANAKSKMPAFKEKLTSQEIESLVPVVMSFRREPAAGDK